MIAGPGIERNEGMLGFDWVTHKNDPQAATDDMRLTGLLPPSVDALKDRFDMVEALSGGNLNDVLRGDDDVAADQVGNELDQAGIDMVSGLAGLLPAGATSFTGGNILIGGEGSDQLEGRGGDDLIDGDVWFNVQLQAAGQAPVDSLSQLQAAVLAGTLDPGTIDIVRSIVSSSGTGFTDTALFTGLRNEYTIATVPGGLTVTHTGGTAVDGTDTLRNIERLRFSDGTIVSVPSITASSPDAGATGVAVGSMVSVNFREAVLGVITTAPSTSTTFTLTPAAGGAAIPAAITRTTLTNGGERYVLDPTANLAGNTAYTVTLTGGAQAIRNAQGIPLPTTSWSFTTVAAPGDTTAPTITARTPGVGATAVLRGANLNVTFSEAVQGVTDTTYTVTPVAGGPALAALVTLNATGRVATLNPSAALAANTQYRVNVTGGATAIRDLANNPLASADWTFTTGS
jgi:hypothetical protein